MNTDIQATVFQELSKYFETERIRELWETIDHVTGTVEEIVSRALDQEYRDKTDCGTESEYFIPSTEYQDVPDWAVLPNGAEYKGHFQTGVQQARWGDPVPGPEAVIDKRTNKPQERPQESRNETSPKAEPPKPKSAEERARQQYASSAADHQSRQEQREDEEDEAEPDWESEVEEISIDDLLSFDRHNDPDSLLGNRWLCRGDTAVIQGETGIGKSTLIMQAIIWWAMAELFFGIKPKHALKSLLIQSENSKGDLGEVFQDVVKAMGLTAGQIKHLKTKIIIIRENTKTGAQFLKLARRLINKHQPDLVFADHYLSYLGDSASDQKAASAFLRGGLQPIVQKSGVIWFWVHHFSKPPRDDQAATRRSVYSGFGSVELPGWARETITVNSINEDERTCEIEFGKRARRVGLVDDQGNPIYKIGIQQSKSGVLWEPCSISQAQKAGSSAAKYKKATKEIRAHIEKGVNVTHDQLKTFAPKISIGETKAISLARSLVDDAEEPRIYEYRIKGRTFGKMAFSTVTRELNPQAFIKAKRSRKKDPKKGAN